MTNQLGRRALAGAAALLPAAALIGSAHAESSPESTFDRVRVIFSVWFWDIVFVLVYF
jgi:hypothetical protein